MSSSALSRDLTTFDLIKAAALIIMIIDHLGFYFFVGMADFYGHNPDLWWRAIGRFGLPVWFFLIGYARTRDIPPLMIIGTIWLVIMNLVTGMFLIPLSALGTMIAIRLSINFLGRVMFGSVEGCASLMVLGVLLYAPSNLFIEYGTVGILLALMGNAVRRMRDRDTGQGQPIGILVEPGVYPIFLTIGVMLTVLTQLLAFAFDWPQMIVATIGLIGTFLVLFFVRPTTYPAFTAAVGQWPTRAIQFCGRRTMEIYIGHLTLFKLIALIFGLGYPIYGWFDWDYGITGTFGHIPR